MNTLILLAATTFLSLAGSAQIARDEATIRKVVIAFQEDFNEGSFSKAHTYTTPDWKHINPIGGISTGRDEVLKEVRSVHQTFLKGVTMTLDSISIKFITPEVAVADVIHKVSPFELPKGVKHENERHIKTYIVVKRNGKWLLTHDHNTIIQQLGSVETPHQ